ncbi:MAG: hypothetical protein BGO05_01190 [Rhizobiales bacterium 63-7]|uniref:hypothetical protein n=1 Tax=Rhizobium sp. YJ-22 TaxID=3037556 RepID=UPI00092AC2B1|nr:hypothetical protein [Rhizobium sp. YJ-22]MBN9029496.1 hypothetical protein [Hyphomicrobiales bacterium]MDG3576697.1 hypothetical protein [Rhizobium sp. YJ-22]OJU71642.1 MAG: hypothetical protein BGO05_01190 [Rhizobiales bacterium 63-7]
MTELAMRYFRGCTDTRIRRKNFFDFACKTYNGSNAVAFLLIEAYRKSGKKRHANFINDNYIKFQKVSEYAKDFPKYSLFMGDINVKDSKRTSIGDETSRQIGSVGLTWKDKIKKQNNALDIFRSVTKMSGTTQIHPDIFEPAQVDISSDLWSVMAPELQENNYGIFNPDSSYQPNSDISANLPKFRKILKENGFDGDEIGIY